MSEARADGPLSSAEIPAEYETAPLPQLDVCFEQLVEQGYYPTALLQGGEVVDLLKGEVIGSHERPFAVFDVAVPDEHIQTAIYKACIEEKAVPAACNEIAFIAGGGMELVTQRITERAPHIANSVTLPHAYAYSTESDEAFPFILQNTIIGETLGQVNSLGDTSLTEHDMETIAEFIRTFRDISTEDLHEVDGLNHQTLTNTRHANVVTHFEIEFDDKEEFIRPHLGDEYWSKLDALLEESRAYYEDKPPASLFAAGDINFSNIIKTPEGEMAFIDWERIRMTNSEALDYGFIFATLKDHPELQASFLSHAMRLNEDVPDFKQQMKYDFALSRGSGELATWSRFAREAAERGDVHAQANCLEQVAIFSDLVKECLDEQGIWSNEEA